MRFAPWAAACVACAALACAAGLLLAVADAQTTQAPSNSPVASYGLSRVSGATPVLATGTPTSQGFVYFGPQAANPDHSGLVRAVSAANGDAWTAPGHGSYFVMVNVPAVFASSGASTVALSRSQTSGTPYFTQTFATLLASCTLEAKTGCTVSWGGFVAGGDVLRVFVGCASPCVFDATDTSASVTFIYDRAAALLTTQLTTTTPALGSAASCTTLYFGTGTVPSPNNAGVTRTTDAVNGDNWAVASAGLYCIQTSFLQGTVGAQLSRNAPSTQPVAFSATTNLLVQSQDLANAGLAWCGLLAASDAVRVQTPSVTASPTTPAASFGVQFTLLSAATTSNTWTSSTPATVIATLTALSLTLTATPTPSPAGITYAPSLVNGDTFTVATTGTYVVTWQGTATPTTSSTLWASRNAPNNVAENGMTPEQKLGQDTIKTGSTDTAAFGVTWNVVFFAGDVVRLHTDAAAIGSTGSAITFTRLVGTSGAPSMSPSKSPSKSPSRSPSRSPTLTTSSPTTHTPSRAPTGASTGFYLVSSGTSAPTSNAVVTEATTYWTGGNAPQSAGTTITLSPTASGRIAVTTTGLYLISFTAVWSSVAGAADRQAWLVRNAAATTGNNRIAFIITSYSDAKLSGQALQTLTAADYVSLFVYQSTGSALSLYPSQPSTFSIASTSDEPYYVMHSGTAQPTPSGTITPLTTFWTASPVASTSLGTVVTNPSNGQLKVSVAGAYLVSYGFYWDTSSSGDKQSWILKNGAATSTTNRYCYISTEEAWTLGTTATCVMVLSAADTFVVNVFQNFGTLSPDPVITTAFGAVRLAGPYYSITSTTAQAVLLNTPTELTTHWSGGTVQTGSTLASPTAGRVRVTQTGSYYVTAQIPWVAAGSANIQQAWAYVNGAGTMYGLVGSSSAAGLALNVATLVPMNAGDYVSIWALQASLTTQNVDNSLTCWFSVVQMSTTGVTLGPSKSPSRSPSRSPTLTTSSPTTHTPSTSPTTTAKGYYAYTAGTAQPVPSPGGSAQFGLSTYWTGGAAAQTAGTAATAGPTTGSITINTAGLYLSLFSVAFGSSTSAFGCDAYFSINGASALGSVYLHPRDGQAQANFVPILSSVGAIVLSATSAITIGAYTGTANAMSITNPTQFAIVSTEGAAYYVLSGNAASSPSIATSTITALTSFWGSPASLGGIWTAAGSTGKISPTVGGMYMVFWGFSWSTSGAITVQSWAYVNGAGTRYGFNSVDQTQGYVVGSLM